MTAILDDFAALVGECNVLTGEAAAPFCSDWRDRYSGTALAVIRPGTADEVAAVVRRCALSRTPIVPQGGNTGLCGGATPDASGTALLLSLQRLNRIRAIDRHNDSMDVEAGCILQSVQEAAAEADRLFPLSLAAEGSCTIGGNLATNAGGTQVLRYGNMRDLTLGLEVVTPQGDIWHGLGGLRKNNTGYDLRDLYIGSEGTLGIITAATLKLYPRPAARCTAWLAVESLEHARELLGHARRGFAAALTGFELMAGECLAEVVRCYPQQRVPLGDSPSDWPWHVLLELSDHDSEEHARQRFESVLSEAIEAGCVADAVIASSGAQSQQLWHLRESIPMAERETGKSVKHDISVPVSVMPEFVRDTNAALQDAFPGVRHVIFGHLGDGNLHYNVATGPDWNEARLLAAEHDIHELVHARVHDAGGAISAEHGIGQLKRDALPRYQDATALSVMSAIKRALDPANLMNPGKVLISQTNVASES